MCAEQGYECDKVKQCVHDKVVPRRAPKITIIDSVQ